jgi:ATP-dependent DNA helicase DinG
MRQRATDADIVIVNHHLFFADLALRGGEYGQVIPDYSAVIFDEAHQIEDVAAEYFGAQVSSYQIEDVLRDLQALPINDADANKELTRASARVARFAEHFWLGFQQDSRGEEQGRSPILPGTFARKDARGEIEPTSVGQSYLALDGALARMDATLDALRDPPPEVDNVLRRVRELRFQMEFIVAGDDKRFVYWLERRGRGTFLRASPIDVSTLLQEKLFDRVETCVLTSATLASANSFQFVRERLGLIEKTDELIARSGFDYERQAILYLPPQMPAPRVNFPCFVQGDASKTFLLDTFRQTPHAVLFATSSFWQGVDVRGDALSCVIVDKLPFAVPTDPIVAARQRFIEDAGGSSFYEYSVPQAIISLKQGLGRLIRSATDRGVLSVLDPRLRTQGYGKKFLASLPVRRTTSDLAEVARVFETDEAAVR